MPLHGAAKGAIEFGIHICPQCRKDIASGVNAMTGKPQICEKCIVRNVKLRISQREYEEMCEREQMLGMEVDARQPAAIGVVMAAVGIVLVGLLFWLAGGS